MDVSISIEQLGRFIGKDPVELGETLFEKDGENPKQKEGAGKIINELFNAKFKSLVDEHHRRGVRETWEKVEKYAKDSDPEFDPKGGQGIDLLTGYVESQKSKAAKGAGTLSEEDLEKNPLVTALISKHTAKAKTLLDERAKELERLKGEYSNNSKRAVARAKLVAALPPDLFAGDDETEQTRKKDILFELLEHRLQNLELTDDGKDVKIFRKPGEVWTDDSLNPIQYGEFLRTFNPYTPKPGNNGKGSPGANTSIVGQSGTIKVASKQDYDSLISTAKTSEERAAVNGAYADFLAKSEGQK
jgi:hypothetical protein